MVVGIDNLPCLTMERADRKSQKAMSVNTSARISRILAAGTYFVQVSAPTSTVQ